jgi:hypothetical protein
MKQFKIFFSLVLVALLFTNCESNDSSSTSQNDDTFVENFGASASRDFIGQVVDIDNVPLQNVSIKIGTSTVQTDVNGVFIINGAAVHERFAYITAKKTGYIDGSRAMVPTSGKNNVKIMLLPNAPLETIQSGETSEVSIYSGTKVVFDGSFQDENGAAYKGAVQVSMFHLTPSDENIDKLMPGMLYAQTQSNEEAVLETFGMLNVELRGSAGQKLNIATGHTAEITLRIDDSQIATAPNTIPLWHFDDTVGYWKEDGVATKVGNKYIGEVSHFSWWNCDTFASTVSLTVTIVDGNGNPISNVGVGLTVNSSNFNSYIQFTGSNGEVSGLIPANETITLNLYGICGNVIYTTQTGPYSQNTVLPPINFTSNETTIVTKVQGAFAKCDDTPVTNGYMFLYYGNQTILNELDSGDYSFSVLKCSGSDVFELEGYDFVNFQTTGRIAYNFTLPVTIIPKFKSCNDVNEFITCSIDGVSHLFTSPFTMSSNNTGFDMLYYQNDGIFSISWFYPSYLPGTYGSNGATFFQMQTSYSGLSSTAYILNSNSSVTYKVNKFGAIGEYIDIAFNGTYNNSDLVVHTVVGVVHIQRDN